MQTGDAVPDADVPDTVPVEIVVHRGGREYRVKYQAGDTLLEALWREGVRVAFSCEQGECGACVVRRLKGEVRLRRNMVLTDDDLAQGYTLACQGEPLGTDCEIAIEE